MVWVNKQLGFRFLLASNVTDYLCRNRQLRRRDLEAGGPLFSAAPGLVCEVTEVSGPFSRDRRSRHGYVPHRPSVQADINEKHASGLHFIGNWHTHPSARPVASHPDTKSMLNLFKESTHDLNVFLMVIVGTENDPAHWELSITWLVWS
ncbi:MAG: Mov34/MPN/PAD-1 family protein [Paracoccus sp. (in: a-proteobacteria)]